MKLRKMNKKIKSLLCVCICLCIAISGLVCFAPRFVRAQEAAEDEEITERIIALSTPEEFLEFAENCRLDSFSVGLTVVLENDIDLSGVEFDGIPTFSGVFEGGGNKLIGLSIINNGSIQGLFRYLSAAAIVRELELEGEIIPGGSRSIIGGIAGSNAGVIENCSFEGGVSGADSVGGIVGRNEITGIIDACSTSGSIQGNHSVGGIVGENLGVVRNCENFAQINTTVEQNNVDIADITLESLIGSESAITVTDIGGIAGMNSGVLRDCKNHGSIGYPHIGYNIGGIAGSQIGYITGCENNGKISGRKEIGGIVGQMEPSTELVYEADTMQILEGQLNTMSSMIDSTAANMQGGAGEIQGQIIDLQGHVNNAQDALGQLIPDPNAPDPPDSDSTLAALNNLNSSLTAISNSLSGLYQTGQDTVNTLTGDFADISEQMNAIGSTISGASSNVGGSIVDASDEDTDESITGKVENCVNNGSVQADLNAGGIVGAMAIENDLDPEGDLYISGNSSLNYQCKARAVVLRCENRGTVTAGKQNAGGIAGWMSMGLVRDCINTGAIESANAVYVGGIAGQSQGYIRRCSAKCRLEGSVYVGGIAGIGAIVTECRSMVMIQDGSEKLGAVLGYAGENISPEGEELPMRGNFYLAADRDIGGIDGISYAGIAESLSSEDFLALEELPEVFSVITVRFIFEDGTERAVTLEQGEKLTPSDVPKIPEKSGYTGCWEGLDENELDSIVFDTTFRMVYTPKHPVIQSDEQREGGMPVLLAQGEFAGEQGITLAQLTEVTVSDGDQTLIEAWRFTLPESDSSVQLRYMLPEGYSSDEMKLMVRAASGQWRQVEFTADGSYLVFSITDDDEAFRVEHAPENYLLEILLASGAAVLLLGTIIITRMIKKKRQAKSEKPKAESEAASA